MPKFYITFGQKYKHESHPTFKLAHPDGYVVIDAPNMTRARECAFRNFGPAWSMIYEEDEFFPALYPKGVLGTFETELSME